MVLERASLGPVQIPHVRSSAVTDVFLN